MHCTHQPTAAQQVEVRLRNMHMRTRWQSSTGCVSKIEQQRAATLHHLEWPQGCKRAPLSKGQQENVPAKSQRVQTRAGDARWDAALKPL